MQRHRVAHCERSVGCMSSTCTLSTDHQYYVCASNDNATSCWMSVRITMRGIFDSIYKIYKLLHIRFTFFHISHIPCFYGLRWGDEGTFMNFLCRKQARKKSEKDSACSVWARLLTQPSMNETLPWRSCREKNDNFWPLRNRCSPPFQKLCAWMNSRFWSFLLVLLLRNIEIFLRDDLTEKRAKWIRVQKNGILQFVSNDKSSLSTQRRKKSIW